MVEHIYHTLSLSWISTKVIKYYSLHIFRSLFPIWIKTLPREIGVWEIVVVVRKVGVLDTDFVSRFSMDLLYSFASPRHRPRLVSFGTSRVILIYMTNQVICSVRTSSWLPILSICVEYLGITRVTRLPHSLR